MLMVMKSLLILLLLIVFGTALVHASVYYVICGYCFRLRLLGNRPKRQI
jgi:hypothetical protein